MANNEQATLIQGFLAFYSTTTTTSV